MKKFSLYFTNLLVILLACSAPCDLHAAPIPKPPTLGQKQTFVKREVARMSNSATEVLSGWADEAKSLAHNLDSKRQASESAIAISTMQSMLQISNSFNASSPFAKILGFSVTGPYSVGAATIDIDADELIREWNLIGDLADRARVLVNEYKADMAPIPDDVTPEQQAAVNAQLDALAQKYQAALTLAENQLGQLQTEVAALRSQSSPLKTRISQIDSELSELDTRAALIGQDLAGLNQALAIATDASQIATLNAQINSAQTELASINQQKASLNSEKSSLTTQIEGLDGQISVKDLEIQKLARVDIPFRHLQLNQNTQLDQILESSSGIANLNITELLNSIDIDFGALDGLTDTIANAVENIGRLQQAIGDARRTISRVNSIKNYMDQIKRLGSGMVRTLRELLNLDSLKDLVRMVVKEIVNKFKDLLKNVVPRWIVDFLFAREFVPAAQTSGLNIPIDGIKSCSAMKKQAKREKCMIAQSRQWTREKAKLKAARKQIAQGMQAQLVSISRETNGGASTPEILAEAAAQIANIGQ